MAYVAVPGATRDLRRSVARERWDAIEVARPDLTPAVELQRRLIEPIIELAETIEHGRLPRLSLPTRYLGAKLGRRIPAFAAEPIPIPTRVLTPVLLTLCDELARGGAGDSAAHIRAAIDAGSIDAGSLLSASLSRDQNAIRTAGAHRGLASDLLWLVAELAVSPFVHALGHRVLFPHGQGQPDATLVEALDAWQQGYCPLCGSWPGMVEAFQAARVLRCSFCAFAWSLPDGSCLYCGEASGEFTATAADPSRQDRRLELCRTCRSYVKTVDVDELSLFPLLSISDLETMDLDMLAMKQGFQRPQLRTFAVAGKV